MQKIRLLPYDPKSPDHAEWRKKFMPDETELDGDDDEEILDPAGEPDSYPDTSD